MAQVHALCAGRWTKFHSFPLLLKDVMFCPIVQAVMLVIPLSVHDLYSAKLHEYNNSWKRMLSYIICCFTEMQYLIMFTCDFYANKNTMGSVDYRCKRNASPLEPKSASNAFIQEDMYF